MSDTAIVTVFVHHETDAAYMVSDTGDKDDAVWLPKSQLINNRDDIKPGQEFDLEIPEWLAIERGLV